MKPIDTQIMYPLTVGEVFQLPEPTHWGSQIAVVLLHMLEALEVGCQTGSF